MTSRPSHSTWVGAPRVYGRSEFTRMILLTFSIIGLQFCWGTEMTYATPYLLALGLSKSHLSLVWIAGPLSGLIMQPVIGMVSDRSSSKYGRRRPFMIGGSVAVAVCLVVLGWAKEIVEVVVGHGELSARLTVWLAVLDIYVLDFVINVAQATCRALVVDTLPVEKQQLGSAWVSRMVGVGHMLIYAVGALDLNAVLGSHLGDTQFKKMCAIAAMAMLFAQSVTCWAVEERVLVSDGSKAHGTDQGIVSIIKQIYISFSDCPERIQAVCWIQFWAWIGFFPFMFYGSTWVGEIYLRTQAPSKHTEDALSEVGRAGSTAMIIYSIVGFLAAIFLPTLVESPEQHDEKRDYYTPRPPEHMRATLKWFKAHRPTLLTAWAFSNLTFGCVMIWAPMVRSVGFATFLMACCGIPSAVSHLATGTFLGIEVNRLGSSLPGSSHRRTSSKLDSDDYAIEMEGGSSDSEQRFLHLRHDSDASQGTSSTGELAGIYLGIFNIYQTIPQFIGTAISWVVFSILEPGKSAELALDASPADKKAKDGLSGIGVCLFIGALSSFVAAYSTKRLRRPRS